MKRYPMNLAIEGRRVIVVGGGSVGARKCRMLIAAGAHVVVISPAVGQDVMEMVSKGNLHWSQESFTPDCLDGAHLAFAATNDPDVNLQVVQVARERGILVNLADDSEGADFHVPAVVRRGNLVITISTGGTCPGFSQNLKRRIEGELTDGVGIALEIATRVRQQVMKEKGGWASKASYQSLLTEGFMDACDAKDATRIDGMLRDVMGSDYSLHSLGMDELSGWEDCSL